MKRKSMKRKSMIFLMVFILAVVLSACGASGAYDIENPAIDESIMWHAETEDIAPVLDGWGDQELTLDTAVFVESFSSDQPVTSSIESYGFRSPSAISPDQIVFSANVQLLTDNFEESIFMLESIISSVDGFIQFSNRQAGFDGEKWASYTIRVPSDLFQQTVRDIEGIGELRSSSSNAENISNEYADVTARITSLRAQEARILALMEQADNMEDIIFLESRLSDIIMQIERMTTSRNLMDSQMAYSTISVFISETDEGMIQATSSLGDAGNVLINSLTTLRNVGVALVLFFVAILPWVIVIGVIVVPIVLIAKNVKKNKKHKVKKEKVEKVADLI